MKALNLKQHLFQPYPYYYDQKNLPQLVLSIIILCFIFNFFFEPFTVYKPEHKIHFFWISLVHSVLPAFIGYLYFSVVNRYFKNEEKWTVAHEILHLALALLLIGTGNFLIRDFIYDNPENWSVRYLLEEVLHAFLVGMLFVAILVPLNRRRLSEKYHQKAASINDAHKVKPLNAEERLTFNIKTQVKGDDFELELADFIYARAAGNYVELFVESETGISKLLKRMAIKDLESQLSSTSWIFKTHRAFLVNINKIQSIQGNAQGYQLSFEGAQEKVPVSRSLISEFNAVVNEK